SPMPSMPPQNHSYERDSTASPLVSLRTLLYQGSYHQGVAIAQYSTLHCASDAIYGKNPSSNDSLAAGLGSFVTLDRVYYLSRFFDELSKTVPIFSEYKASLSKIAAHFSSLATTKSVALASLPPVTSAERFSL
ncbi:MAG: hypothetical protein QW594_02870, partial [Candidatus Woesearchaeota archaeon]